MNEELLDSENEIQKNPLFEINIGLILIIISIVVELILFMLGPYIVTCGIKLLDILSIFVTGFGSIFIYQLLRKKLGKFHWILISIGIGINLFLGIIGYSTIC